MKPAAAIVESLARTPCFAGVGRGDLEKLGKTARRKRLRRGELLWERFEKVDSVALLLRGRLDISRTTQAGDRALLRSLFAPSVVGLASIAGLPHSADVVAGAEVELALIPGRAVRALFTRNDGAALGAIIHLGGLVERLSDELEDLRFRDIRDRVAGLICRQAHERREIRFTHEEIADRVGASRANVSRALKQLERQGIIRCGRGRIEILSGA